MSERFTDRARKVMALATEEAIRFYHGYVNPEHILLGLIKEGDGVGANVLKNLGIDLNKARVEVEKLMKAGPKMLPMLPGPQTYEAKRVIELANQEAQRLGHNQIDIEHLLLGLLHEHGGTGGQALSNMGITLETAREKVYSLIKPTPANTRQLLDLFGVQLNPTDFLTLHNSLSSQPMVKLAPAGPDFPCLPGELAQARTVVAGMTPEQYLDTVPKPLAAFLVALCLDIQKHPTALAVTRAVFPPKIADYLCPAVEADEYNPAAARLAALAELACANRALAHAK